MSDIVSWELRQRQWGGTYRAHDVAETADDASESLGAFADRIRHAPAAHPQYSDVATCWLIGILEDTDNRNPDWGKIREAAEDAHGSDYHPVSRGVDGEPESDLQCEITNLIAWLNHQTERIEK